jgi:hypothetical protein
MKKISVLFFAILLLGSCKKEGIQEEEVRDYDFIKNLNIVQIEDLTEYIEITNKLYQAALESRIKAYTDDSLKTEFTRDELIRQGRSEETISLYPDPEKYPDWSYDSIIIKAFDPKLISGFNFAGKLKYDPEKGEYTISIKAISMCFRQSVEGVTIPNRNLFWMDVKNLDEYLPEKFKGFYNYYFLEALAYQAAVKETPYIRSVNKLHDFIGKYNLLNINKKLYNKARDNKLIAYTSDSLTKKYTKEEFLLRGSQEEYIKIIPDPKNQPDYYYDTLIREPYNLRNHCCNMMISRQYSINNNEIILKNNAIAPLYTKYVENIHFINLPLYWIQYKNLNKILENESSVLTSAFHKEFLQQMGHEEFIF